MTEYIVRLEHDADGAVHYVRQIDGELVRCKECKHLFTDFVMDGKEYKRCEMQMAGFHDDWYCADGERKDDETD